MSQTSSSHPLKSKLAVLIFVLGCLLSTARIVKDAPIPAHPDDIAKRSDQRFAALKAALPQGEVVGYVGESGNPALADYYLAQYALAPVVVDHSPNHALVIGNFPASATPEFAADLQLVRDFGDGVLLLAHRDAE